ncbi:hypothetical protein [Streptomyces sp. AC550_RSS872]|uniref:hypothetical protein n=1 Tax=Streptomyces sp. AC550_RSS872 TaxID=2823689 RepID=UPI001C27B39A|nr:hypothetical protein [Streptomyces sp. AC550_RSS872]
MRIRHFELAQGRRQPGDPGAPPTGTFTQQGGLNLNLTDSSELSSQFGWACREDCVPDLGAAPAVPDPCAGRPRADGGYASLTWLPGYALTPNEQVAGKKDLFHAVGDRPDAQTAVIAIDGRGNDGWSYGQSGASTFETMADAARH